MFKNNTNLIILIAKIKIIDLSDGKGRFLQLNYQKVKENRYCLMGFLPNGDMILVSTNKIYLYAFINKPTNVTLWEYSQV